MLEYTVWQRGPRLALQYMPGPLTCSAFLAIRHCQAYQVPGVQLKMQITKYALSAFAWMVHDA
jgi:hypothetical protein